MSYGLKTFSAGAVLLLASFSSSPTYQLQNYGLGSGGTSNSSSDNYRLNANSGEVSGSPTAGATTTDNSGSTQTRQANVPLAPTLSNGSGTFYNKLLFIIQTTGSDPSDYTYSVAVSTNNFVTTNFVQADGTLAPTPVYRTYADWGGVAGSMAIGLSSGTTYKFKVNAMQGAFTQSAFGPEATIATANPALTFSITPNSISLGSLLAGNVVSGASPITFAFSTNAAAGGSVYVAGANGGLKSSAVNYTIPALSNSLNSQTQGFGMQGLTTGQTSGGPLTVMVPFNSGGNIVGAPSASFKQLFASTSAISGGTATAGIKGKASATTPSASDYTEILTFIASASF